MGTDKWTAAGFLAVYFAVRIIDYILPGGHHFRLSDRWATKDDEEVTDEDT